MPKEHTIQVTDPAKAFEYRDALFAKEQVEVSTEKFLGMAMVSSVLEKEGLNWEVTLIEDGPNRKELN